MDLAAIIADASYVLGIGKLALSLAQDAAPFVEAAYTLLVNKTTLTPVQRADLLAKETILRGELNAASIPADAP